MYRQLSHWDRDKMAAILQTTFSNAFSCLKMYELRLRFHWSLGPTNNIQALVQIMAWRWPGDKLLSELMMVSFFTHICVTRPQWVTEILTIDMSWLSLMSSHEVYSNLIILWDRFLFVISTLHAILCYRWPCNSKVRLNSNKLLI